MNLDHHTLGLVVWCVEYMSRVTDDSAGEDRGGLGGDNNKMSTRAGMQETSQITAIIA